MKRSSLLLFAVLASAFASAEVTSSNTLCWIAVNSTSSNTVVSASLVNVGLPATNVINVSDFILPRNLKRGDMVQRKVLDAETNWVWKCWALDKDGNEGGVWVPQGVTQGNKSYAAPSESETTFDLADAFILYRFDPANSNPFYICGQVESSTPRTQTASGLVTLMSNAGLTDVYIENIPWVDGHLPADGDILSQVTDNPGVGTIDYIWTTPEGGSENCWCTNAVSWTTGSRPRMVITHEAVGDNNVVIPVGQGFYLQRGSTAEPHPSIAWRVD